MTCRNSLASPATSSSQHPVSLPIPGFTSVQWLPKRLAASRPRRWRTVKSTWTPSSRECGGQRHGSGRVSGANFLEYCEHVARYACNSFSSSAFNITRPVSHVLGPSRLWLASRNRTVQSVCDGGGILYCYATGDTPSLPLGGTYNMAPVTYNIGSNYTSWCACADFGVQISRPQGREPLARARESTVQ